MMNFRTFLVFLLCIGTHQLNLAQQAGDSTSTYTWFDTMVGQENTNLFNGVEYLEQHPTVNEKQKFLESVLFLPGDVVYYDEPYYSVGLKYNVYDDLLLVKNLRGEAIELHKNKIKSFSLAGHSFTHVRDSLSGNASGFYEMLFNTPRVRLLKKHRKKSRKFLDRAFTYFEFTEDTPHYVLFHDGRYFSANSRREVIRAFPEKASHIRDFYRSQRRLEQREKDLFMLRLLQVLNVSSNNLP